MSEALPGRRVLAQVAANTALANPEYRELTLVAPVIVAAASPGQFVHLKLVGEGSDPFLRRPFSISGLDGDRLTILFRRVGDLTERLAALRPDDAVDVLGPLGHGYDLTGPPGGRAFLAGGGYGVAPLLILARALRDRGVAREVHLLVGARTTAHLLWQDRLAAEADWLKTGFATDDGSSGFRGTVLDLLADRMGPPRVDDRLFGCGPMAMLGGLARRWPGLPAQVAVENQMGCGVGVCLGCVLPHAGGTGHRRYIRICTEGPVFDARALEWVA